MQPATENASSNIAKPEGRPDGKGGFMEQVRTLAEQVSEREGCALYDVELIGAGTSRVLRVYIDKAAGPVTEPAAEATGGVGASIEDCSNVSRGLNLILDVEDPIPGGAYNLEVSTPGLERVLRLPWHFERVIGQTVTAKSFAPLTDFNPQMPELGKARQLTGTLASIDDKGVRIEWAGAYGQQTGGQQIGQQTNEEDAVAKPTVFIPFESITKANVVFKFDEGSARPVAQKKPSKKKEKRKR